MEELSEHSFEPPACCSRKYLRVAIWPLLLLSIMFTLPLLHYVSQSSDTETVAAPPYDLTALTEGELARITLQSGEQKDSDLDYPPSYKDLRKKERSLPQHNFNLPWPEGVNGRYVKFSCQIQQLGWNNVLNEILMNAHLARASNRAYVFSDYVWQTSHYPWSSNKSIEWPPHTPLSALISGPVVGAPWPDGDPAPRSISESWWEIVCPPERRKIINTHAIKPTFNLGDKGGNEVFNTWLEILREEEASCLEIEPAGLDEDQHPQVFDLWLWGSGRVLELWEEFRDGAVSLLLRPSPIVIKAVEDNKQLFYAPPTPDPDSGSGVIEYKPLASPNPFNRTLAIHLRRGDYESACLGLSNWNSTFYSWSLLPFLPDRFTPPPGGEPGHNTKENEELYMRRCLPTADQIRDRIREAKVQYLAALSPAADSEAPDKQHERGTLDVLYILTNDNTPWLDQLKDTLTREDGWSIVRTSRDLQLTQEGKDVSMAVDMELARRAAVFVGNGWSSFTSNILHQRLVDGRIPMSNRFL